MKRCDKNKASDLKYWDVNSFYGCAISQNLPVGGFKSVKDTSQFNEDLMKTKIN